jgi:hypothetical protein
MPSGPQNFKKTDAARLIRTAEEAGLKISGLILDAGRVILKIGDAPLDNNGGEQQNEWDESYGTQTSEIRPSGSKPKR